MWRKGQCISITNRLVSLSRIPVKQSRIDVDATSSHRRRYDVVPQLCVCYDVCQLSERGPKRMGMASNKFGPRRLKTCLQRFANNTGADQPAQPRSPINAFVMRIFRKYYM